MIATLNKHIKAECIQRSAFFISLTTLLLLTGCHDIKGENNRLRAEVYKLNQQVEELTLKTDGMDKMLKGLEKKLDPLLRFQYSLACYVVESKPPSSSRGITTFD